MLEVLKHHGPARLGIFHLGDKEIRTPALLSLTIDQPFGPELSISDGSTDITDLGSLLLPREVRAFGILPDLAVGLRVPRRLAEEAVEATLAHAVNYPGQGAVVVGSRYLDLRLRCARALVDRPLLAIADGSKLLENPRLLVEVVTGVREVASPNTALYFPGAYPNLFPLLAYMGVDLFDTLQCLMEAARSRLLTPQGPRQVQGMEELPCQCTACAGKGPKDMGYREITDHNLYSALQAVREVRDGIRHGTLRNLVEERASADVRAMAALRILDREKGAFLERYTAVGT
ncbi:MAG: tRNA-guanine transglycosylase [Candidatus Hydrothermarchaeota archaeon]